MNIAGRPEYRRGPQWRQQVCEALGVLQRREAGERLTGEQAALAAALGSALTPWMRRCLELYYVQGSNQEVIARTTGRHRSNVCRCLGRCEAHLERIFGRREGKGLPADGRRDRGQGPEKL